MKRITLLVLSTFVLVAGTVCADDVSKQMAEAEKTLEAKGLKTDGASLLKFFRQRTLTPADRLQVETWIEQLGSNSFRVRETATARLIERGPVVVKMLQEAERHPPDLEVKIRAKECIDTINKKDYRKQIPAAAARLLRQRKPKEVVKVLLDYLPFADSGVVADEVRKTLTALAADDRKFKQDLVKALESKSAVARAAACKALANDSDDQIKQTFRRMLKDPSPLVRWRAAMTLTLAGEREAVPVLIKVLPHIDRVYALRIEDLLLQMGEGDKNLPECRVGTDKETREKCRTAWLSWWKNQGKKIDLSKKKLKQRIRGFTVVVLLDENKVREVGVNNEVRWEINDVKFPLDLQVLPNGNILVAEYNESRVTERNREGDIVWQYRIANPLVAQRLPNGNTFIGTDSQMIEVDKNGRRKNPFAFFNGMRIRKSAWLAEGKVICLRDDSRIVVLDPKSRREFHNFRVVLNRPLFGGKIDVTPKGTVLVPHNARNKVVEYDMNGNAVWEVKVDQPVAARRLANGNTLVTTMEQYRAIEFDPQGRELWEYKTTDTRVTRALRR